MKNTVRKVRLEGELGEKFGEVWNLNVKTPHEAIKAIECQTKGFRKHILDNAEKGIGYEVIIGDQGIKQEEELLYPAPMRDDFTIVPIVQGGKSRGFGMVLIGAALFIASGGASAVIAGIEGAVSAGAGHFGVGTFLETAGGITGGIIAEMGALQATAMFMGGALMAGGAAMMLAPTIDGSAGNEEQSYLFDGAINSVKQGTPVPVLYGRMIVGGSVISASIKSNQETAGVRGRGRTYVGGVGAGWSGYNPGSYISGSTGGKKGKR
jgi:predicted phage tail protein